MLQENAWTGLLFLAGIFCTSFTMGWAAIVATITGTVTAWLMKFPNANTDSGLYGFNAALTGVALLYFFQSTVLIWLIVIIGSALSAIIHHLLIGRNFPAYTFPFIGVTWLVLILAALLPDSMLQPAAAAPADPVHFTDLFGYSFAQVIFQHSNLSGYLFVIGIAISRPLALLYAVGGIAISALVAFGLGAPPAEIFTGIWSYNAVLCAIAFTGTKAGCYRAALLSVVLSVLVMGCMLYLKLPALTFPFVLSTWVTLLFWNNKK